jgi:hypothetical protein
MSFKHTFNDDISKTLHGTEECKHLGGLLHVDPKTVATMTWEQICQLGARIVDEKQASPKLVHLLENFKPTENGSTDNGQHWAAWGVNERHAEQRRQNEKEEARASRRVPGPTVGSHGPIFVDMDLVMMNVTNHMRDVARMNAIK